MLPVPTTRARRTAAAATTRPSPRSLDRDGGGLAYSKKQFEVLTQYRRRSQFQNKSKTIIINGTTTNRPTLVAASAFWKQSSQEGGDGGDDGGDDGAEKGKDDEERKKKNLEENNKKENNDAVDDEDEVPASTRTTAAATSLEVVAATTTDTETNTNAEVEWGSYSSTASTTDNNKDDDILVINGMNTKQSATPTEDRDGSRSTTTTKSLVTLLNDIGNNFKSMAVTATTKGTASSEQSMKILCAIKACLYYTLFILYRSYRGFFVLLPATIRRVYQQMNTVMTNKSNTSNLSMMAEEENEDGTTTTTRTPAAATPPTWKTKVTVSLLTVVVTSSYLVGGVLQMATKFIRTIAQTSNVSKSFEAAADEMVDYEARISRVAGSSDE